MRLAAHVGGTLHIVLPAQRIHTNAGAADVAGHHGQIGDEHDGLCALLMLSHAETVEAHGSPAAGVFDGGGADEFAINASDFFQGINVEFAQAGFEFGPVFTAFFNEVLLHQPGVENETREHVQQRHIGAGTELEVMLGIRHQLNLARVDDDKRRAFHDLLLQAGARDGVAFGRVGADDHDALGEFQIFKGVGRCPSAKAFLHSPGGW